MTKIEELEQQLRELDPEVEGEEYEGKRAGILAELEAEEEEDEAIDYTRDYSLTRPEY